MRLETTSDILVLDSATKLGAAHRGRVAIAASHGGVNAAHYAAMAGVRGVLLNNAGVGKDEAGVAGLRHLEEMGIAAAAVDHMSSRIGDGEDMAANGRVSHVNGTAASVGCRAGDSAMECAVKMLDAPLSATSPAPMTESLFIIRPAEGAMPGIVGADSVSLLSAAHAGMIAITASHGGALAGKPGVSMPLRGVTFSDAGVGKDGAGVTRLPLLSQIGIPAATAGADSCRIGDARSVYEEGIISHVNSEAARLQIRPGDSIRVFAERLAELATSR